MPTRWPAAIAAAVLLAAFPTAPAQAADTAKPAAAAMLDGPWHIVNRHSGKCLTVSFASTEDQARAVQHTCDYSPPFNEEWYFDGARLVNGHSGKCLTVSFASTEDNAWVVQYTCDNSAPHNEDWHREALPSGHSHLVNGHSGKCLTVFFAQTTDNAGAVQHTCDHASPFNEEWLITY